MFYSVQVSVLVDVDGVENAREVAQKRVVEQLKTAGLVHVGDLPQDQLPTGGCFEIFEVI